jgi:hypothetical protein
MADTECFDARVMDLFRAVSQQAINETPEIRGVSVMIDYYGELNEAAKSALWVTRTGSYQDVKEVFGGLEQTGRLMARQAETAVNLVGGMALQVKEWQDRVAALKAEYQTLKEQHGGETNQGSPSPGPEREEATTETDLGPALRSLRPDRSPADP